MKHADDLPLDLLRLRSWFAGNDFVNENPLPDRIDAGKEAGNKVLVDERDAWTRRRVVLGEIASGGDANALRIARRIRNRAYDSKSELRSGS